MPPAGEEEDRMPGQAIRILLVEDEESHAELIRLAFEARGGEFEIIVAQSIEEARGCLGVIVPDLVITDMRLPDGVGTSLIPAGDVAPAFPVVLMTAYGSEQMAVEAIKAGALDYVVKGARSLADMPYVAERWLREWDHIIRRRRAEEDLRENERKYRMLLENLPQKVFHKDRDLVYVSCNRNYALDHGIEPEEVVGKTDYEFFPRELAEKYRADDRRIMERGETEEIVEKYIQDGRELTVQTVKTPLRDEDGQVVGILGIFWDITDRRRAEMEQARLAETIRQAREIVIVTDPRGTIEYVNPAFEKATGYAASEVVGQVGHFLFDGDEFGELLESIRETLDSGQVSSSSGPMKKKDGSVFEVELSVFPVFDSTGKVINHVGIGRDVTQQLALERQLRQAQKLESIGQLAAGIAHEINTPMQYIGDNTRFLEESFAEMVELNRKYGEAFEAAKRGDLNEKLLAEVDEAAEEADVGYLSEEIGKAIEQSLDGIQRVTAIVRAMKDFSHMGQDEKVGVDINRAIESTVTVARNEWKYVADLVTDFDPSLPSVPCYPGEFNQMILNLITNAAHAIGKKIGGRSTEKGQIAISTRQDGDWVEVRVSDTGTGIPEDIRERVFDLFFTTKEVGKGTGQGLSIAHSVVVDKHGGTIFFETETGVGTTFVVRLPTDPGRPNRESRKPGCTVAATGD